MSKWRGLRLNVDIFLCTQDHSLALTSLTYSFWLAEGLFLRLVNHLAASVWRACIIDISVNSSPCRLIFSLLSCQMKHIAVIGCKNQVRVLQSMCLFTDSKMKLCTPTSPGGKVYWRGGVAAGWSEGVEREGWWSLTPNHSLRLFSPKIPTAAALNKNI